MWFLFSQISICYFHLYFSEESLYFPIHFNSIYHSHNELVVIAVLVLVWSF